jgi:transposase
MLTKYKRRPSFSAEEKESLIKEINRRRTRQSDLLIAAEMNIGTSTIPRLVGPRKENGRLVEARQSRKIMAIELHRHGLSLTDVHASMDAKGVKVPKGTIYHWIRNTKNV